MDGTCLERKNLRLRAVFFYCGLFLNNDLNDDRKLKTLSDEMPILLFVLDANFDY